jgi:hypothetical protein
MLRDIQPPFEANAVSAPVVWEVGGVLRFDELLIADAAVELYPIQSFTAEEPVIATERAERLMGEELGNLPLVSDFCPEAAMIEIVSPFGISMSILWKTAQKVHWCWTTFRRIIRQCDLLRMSADRIRTSAAPR